MNTRLSPTNYYTQTVSITERDFKQYLSAVKSLDTHYLTPKIRDYTNLSNAQIEQIRDNYYELLETYNLESPKDI